MQFAGGNMINLPHVEKLTIAILGGVVGGQFVSKGLDAAGIYDVYNPVWNVAIGLLVLLVISLYFR